jgi:hypothetical protein
MPAFETLAMRARNQQKQAQIINKTGWLHHELFRQPQKTPNSALLPSPKCSFTYV